MSLAPASRDPLAWTGLVLVALVLAMPSARPLFAALFPELDRPLYQQDPFLALAATHLALVAASSAAAALVGVGAGLFVTHKAGAEFRPVVETVATIGQTFPPVAVLALAVPATGFGAAPALIALTLYAVLPVTQATIAGIIAVPEPVREAARGMGMSGRQILSRVELSLAAPVILAGIRSAVVINVGTATVASTVGAKTLGSPILIGLNGSNLAYVLQGAVLVALLAVVLDLGFEKLVRRSRRWQRV